MAKAAFYVPRDDPVYKNPAALQKITSMSIPCKLNFELIFVSVELANGDNIYLRSFPSAKIGEFLEFVNQNNLIDEGG